MPHWTAETYDWLVNNNLWKAVVTWCVGMTLGYFAGLRQILKRHKQTQATILDRLNTHTPGGLGDIAKILEHEEQQRETPS